MKLIEPWTFLGVNILEWYLGFIVFMLVSLLVTNIPQGMPIMFVASVATPFLIAKIRRMLRNNNNLIIENVMYVWDIGVLKERLACPQTTSIIAFRFMIVLIVLYSFNIYLFGDEPKFNDISANSGDQISLLGLIILLAGLIVNYLTNGGDKGRQFLEKAVPLYSLEFVFIGTLISFFPLVLMFLGYFDPTSENVKFNNMIEAIFFIVLFLRTNLHFFKVRKYET